MKYLRLYKEGFSQYYWEVEEEVYDNIRDNCLFKPFDKRLVDKLEKCGYNSSTLKKAPNWLKVSYDDPDDKDIIAVWKDYYQPIKHVMIFSLEDRWYLVRIVEKPSSIRRNGVSVFKCDQEEGLMEFLKDNGFIKG